MTASYLNFDLFALAQPKGKDGCCALAQEILMELDNIDALLDGAIARCEEPEPVDA